MGVSESFHGRNGDFWMYNIQSTPVNLHIYIYICIYKKGTICFLSF